MNKIKEKYRQFKEWQKQPHQVAPLSESFNDCTTCGTHYQGNYCPRCGQSAKIGRYSAKKAFLLFLDVWGLGNRGMFRTIRDLILRPGYMIRDYLQGMQMAYFPPFKMFFLIFAMSLLVESGFNIKFENRIKETKESFEKGLAQSQNETNATQMPDQKSNDESAQPDKDYELAHKIIGIVKDGYDWFYSHQTLVMLVGLLLISWPLYLFFRHCPNIPDMRFSEFFVAMVYSSNMIKIYSITIAFLCLNNIFGLQPLIMAIIPLKQLSGYSYWSTALRAAAACIIFLIIQTILIVIVGIVIYSFYANQY